MEYFEVPLSGSDIFLCSDDECPCTDQRRLTPGIDGYLYISPDLVAMRQDCRSWQAAQSKLMNSFNAIASNPFGIVTNGIINPIFLCETGAKKRNLDLVTAAQDARFWVKNGLVPYRATPLIYKSKQKERAGCLVTLLIFSIASFGFILLFSVL